MYILGAANRLINADGSLPYKIIEENLVPTNRGEYVKRMRQNQEPTFANNVSDSINGSSGNSYNSSRQNSIYSNISDLSRSTSINSSNSLLTSSGSLPNHTNADDDSFVSRIMGTLEVNYTFELFIQTWSYNIFGDINIEHFYLKRFLIFLG